MAALTRGDGERLLRFVAEAEGPGGDQAFTPELLGEVGRLVEADAIAYCELDRVRRRELFYVERSPDDEPDIDVDPAVFWDIVIEEDPVCMAHQLGQFGALKMSDFVTRREFRNMRLYELWYGPYGVEYQLDVALPSPLWHTKTLMFSRTGGQDFTERDRLVLDLLQPHLARQWEAARTRRLLSAALARLDRVGDGDSTGVLLLAGSDRPAFVSGAARRLIRDFFQPETRGGLPHELARWLESGAERPFNRHRSDRVLTVKREGEALLLEERREAVRLTGREQEVVSWVARGKTNAEVAELLWLAPSTVRKHLENVYSKLGVNTRTAAVVSFLGLLDAEAS